MADPLKVLNNHDASQLKESGQKELWYKGGLKFQCTECGKCCTGSPGYAWVTETEIAAMAKYLNLSLESFCENYIRKVNGRLALLEKAPSYDCIFLKDRKCAIYPVRPKQCRTYPWWPQNLKSEKDWQEAALYCEGIREDAAVVPFETIRQQLAIQEGTFIPQEKCDQTGESPCV